MKNIFSLLIILMMSISIQQMNSQTPDFFSKAFTDLGYIEFKKVMYWEEENALVVNTNDRLFYKLDLNGNILAEHHLTKSHIFTDFTIHDNTVYLITDYLHDSLEIRKLNSDFETEWIKRYDMYFYVAQELLDIKWTGEGNINVLFRKISVSLTESDFGYLKKYPGSRESLNNYEYLEFDNDWNLSYRMDYHFLFDNYNLITALITDTQIYSLGFNYDYHISDVLGFLPDSRRLIMEKSSPLFPSEYQSTPNIFPYSIQAFNSNQLLTTGYKVNHISPSHTTTAQIAILDDNQISLFEVDDIGIPFGNSRLYNAFYNDEKIYAYGKLNMSEEDLIPHQLYMINLDGDFIKTQGMNHSIDTKEGDIFSGLQLPDNRLVFVGQIFDLSLNKPIPWLLITDENGCINEDCSYPLPPTSIDKYSENAFSIYPNPTLNGIFYISLDPNNTRMTEIEIFNPLGQKVYQISHDAHSSLIEIDLSAQSKGIYYVIVKTPKGQSVKKITMN